MKSTRNANTVEKYSVTSAYFQPTKANAPDIKLTFLKIIYTIDNAENVKPSSKRTKDAII